VKLDHLAEVLRSPEQALRACHDEDVEAPIAATALSAIVACSAAFGAVLGLRTGAAQVALSAIKLPLATLLSLALSGPLLFALAALSGKRWRFRTVLAVMLTAGARASLVLLAAAPVLLLLVTFGQSYAVVKLAAVLAYALAGRSALPVLVGSLGAGPGRRLSVVAFAGLFFVAGAQSAWVLRPYLGRPDLGPVPIVATGAEGGLVTAVMEAASHVLGRGP
jgi:hypothetical protein